MNNVNNLENTKNRKKVSAAQRRANDKWDKNNLKRYSLVVPIKLAENFENYCKINNISKNKAICNAIKEKLMHDGYLSDDAGNDTP